MTLCLINSDTNRQYFNLINNIYLQPKAQIILNSETEEATVGMSSTTWGRPPLPLPFTIVLKFLSDRKGPEIDMNHNYRRERDTIIIFSPW